MDNIFSLALTVIFLVTVFYNGVFFWRKTDGKYDLVDSLIAIALGVVVSGFCWVGSLILGVPPQFGAPAAMLLVGGYSLLKNKKCVDFSFGFGTIKDTIFFFFAFFCFGGLTLVASIKMGQGADFPLVFFNMDSPLRLAHSHNLASAVEYPPESIYVLGTKHAYHYGAPASVAMIAFATQSVMHKAMFWLYCPLILLGTFCSFYRIVGTLIQNRLWQKWSIFLFAPFVFMAWGGRDLVTGVDIAVGNLVSILADGDDATYNPATFGNGVWDAAVLVGLFLLGFSALLSSQPRKETSILTIVLLLVLIVLNKMDMTAVVYTILFCTVWFKCDQLGVLKKVGLSLFMVVLPLVLLTLFQYGGKQSEMQMATVRSLDTIMGAFSLDNVWGNRYLFELFASLLVTGVVLACSFFRELQINERARFVACIMAAMFMTYLVPNVIHIPKTGGQFVLAMWVGIPLVTTALIGSRAFQSSVILKIVLLPVIGYGLVAQWNKLQHGLIAIASPVLAEEFADVQSLGAVLRHIPVENRKSTDEQRVYERYVEYYVDLERAYNKSQRNLSKAEWGRQHYDSFGRSENRPVLESDKVVVVTNDFRYLKFPDSQIALPAMFGHQTYSSHQRLFPGPNGYNVEAARRIWLQEDELSRKFSKSNLEHSLRVKKLAYDLGWTHFLLKKDPNPDWDPIDATSIPLKMLVENSEYAVFEF